MSVREIRDNLTIGLTLAEQYPYGLPLEPLLVLALGYTPGGPWPIGNRGGYISRLHQAQSLGLDKYARREPGYFTINAQPFGNIFIYKAVWYTWPNPTTGKASVVLVCSTDLVTMRRWREQYLETRTRSTRSVGAADNLVRQDKALARSDNQEVQRIQAGMVRDGTLGEIVTGLLGMPYVDVPTTLDLLSQGNPYGSAQYHFTKQAQRIRQLERRLADEQSSIVRQLSKFISAKQGLPKNAVQLALADARGRLANLP